MRDSPECPGVAHYVKRGSVTRVTMSLLGKGAGSVNKSLLSPDCGPDAVLRSLHTLIAFCTYTLLGRRHLPILQTWKVRRHREVTAGEPLCLDSGPHCSTFPPAENRPPSSGGCVVCGERPDPGLRQCAAPLPAQSLSLEMIPDACAFPSWPVESVPIQGGLRPGSGPPSPSLGAIPGQCPLLREL